MSGLKKRFLYGLSVAFLSVGLALGTEQDALRIEPNDLQGLGQNNADYSAKSIQVDIFMSRYDRRFETLYDSYIMQDEDPITTRKVFANLHFKIKSLLPILLDKPSSPLAITVAVHTDGGEKRIVKHSIIEVADVNSLLDGLEQ